jgi:hypothetical protein
MLRSKVVVYLVDVRNKEIPDILAFATGAVIDGHPPFVVSDVDDVGTHHFDVFIHHVEEQLVAVRI